MAMLTRSDARERFASAGLAYKDVSEADVQMLRSMLDVELRRTGYLMAYVECDALLTCHAVPGVVFIADDGGGMRRAFIVTEFDGQEVEGISFHEKGFIGFCGWASCELAQPYLGAFMDWVTLLETRAWVRELMGTRNA